MRDLEFRPAIPVFAAALVDGEGAFAAANLIRLGKIGESALLVALQDTNPAVRAHAASAAGELFTLPQKLFSLDYRWDDPGRRVLNHERLILLSTLLNDTDPEVRLHSVGAAVRAPSSIFFNRMLKLVRDENAEVSEAALRYLELLRGELPKHVFLFRQMLHDTNANVQNAGLIFLRMNHVEIPRDELVPWLSVPHYEVAIGAYGDLRARGISCEEAMGLLHNSLWVARRVGLGILMKNWTNQSVELAIPLLNDPVEVIRLQAYDLLKRLTGQDFPAERLDE